MKTNFKNETLEEVLTKPESYVFENPISQYTPNEHLGIEKISLEDDFTRIDFVYIAPKQYINGGWIQIDAGCFIRPIGSEVRYKMVSTINIPIAPAKYYFKSKGQVHHFSLIFPALPKNVKQIDIIEKLAEGTFFNFFRVALQHNAPTLIRIINEN
ncbi:hypothetical protein [Flavobacterium aciduliphilum]|uniref:Uncharacterized protein n=1 Tax=Flavobacterium aciduliphilum TaxID=1101402 RepID=A0A328YTC5_9FLAO|nr:hypothetical protein [Flavobacterium aciduliphilum]RAR73797.1 hypothetical protein CLV55_103116 [Flavobacterium aciduliphilum]